MTSNSESPPQGRDRRLGEYRNGSGGQSSSGAPTTATTESGGSSSKSRTTNRFLPFPASKACDICKLRKVKCVGGQPCEACRLHTTECVFSGFTRKQLLQEHSRPRGGSSSGNERVGEGTSGDVGSVPPFRQNQSPSAPSAPTDPVPPDWITPTLASMPVPYGMIPVDWSGISWPTPSLPVPRDSISSESSSGNKNSNGDGDGDGEDRREGSPHVNLTIQRMREDAFGNAGMILYEGDSGSRNMEFWGITSYIGLQDLLTRMLQVRIQQSHEPIGQKAFKQRRGIEPESREADLWRWGCERYIFRDRLRDPDMPNPDPMFLPSRMAYRFLHQFSHVIHPLFPVLDLAAVERSIAASFDASRPGVRRPFPDVASPRIERARDMLVLAFGAQVISGDGDGDCPKDIAVVWSETLRRAAHRIMIDTDAFEGGIDLIRLWIIYAEFSRSYGNSGAEIEAMNTAARSITRMGLHKRGTYEFDVAQANDYRTVFAVSFYSEKWACLCHGNPSTLAWGTDAIEIAAGMKENSRLSVMMRLARLADDVQSVFDELAVLSSEAGIRRLLDLYKRVLAFHAEVGGHFDAVAHLRIELPREFDRDGDYQRTLVLFTIYGMYLQVKTLCLLPMLQLCVWQALGRDGFGDVGLEAGQYVEGLADECVKTACDTINMFERHIAMYPHTPELSLSSIFMLYAVSIVYMDVLRLPVVIASTRHAGHIKSALKKLEHYDHPAATLAETMCRDLLANFIYETSPDNEAQGMEMQI